MGQSTTTTTMPEKKIDLSTFLDMQKLTRAERSYYTKHYRSEIGEKTVAEWSKIVKFIHN